MNRRNSNGRFTLPRDYLTTRSVYDLETDRLINRHWNCVSRESSIPDQGFLRFQMDDHDLILTRNGGEVHAFHNVCRHRGTRLIDQSRGTLKNGCVTCPYHAWTYDGTGQLVGAPNMADVVEFDKSEFNLTPVACHQSMGFVFLSLDPEEDFATWIAPLRERMENWQLEKLQ